MVWCPRHGLDRFRERELSEKAAREHLGLVHDPDPRCWERLSLLLYDRGPSCLATSQSERKNRLRPLQRFTLHGLLRFSEGTLQGACSMWMQRGGTKRNWKIFNAVNRNSFAEMKTKKSVHAALNTVGQGLSTRGRGARRRAIEHTMKRYVSAEQLRRLKTWDPGRSLATGGILSSSSGPDTVDKRRKSVRTKSKGMPDWVTINSCNCEQDSIED